MGPIQIGHRKWLGRTLSAIPSIGIGLYSFPYVRPLSHFSDSCRKPLKEISELKPRHLVDGNLRLLNALQIVRLKLIYAQREETEGFLLFCLSNLLG